MMRSSSTIAIWSSAIAIVAIAASIAWAWTSPPSEELIAEGEKHFANMHMLTNGGENAECYWDETGTRLIFQSTRDSFDCDQIYTMYADGSDQKMVSTGKGRTTCSYYIPRTNRILFSSTHHGSEVCPPKPDMTHGYVWAIYKDYDIYTANVDGSDLRPLTTTPGYDAEATVSWDGKHIVFTSMRDGDLDLYTMDVDGTHVRRITKTLGYDGGAYYSPDNRHIVYRAYHPDSGKQTDEYLDLLHQGLIHPTTLEIWICDSNGANAHAVTHNGKANFCPYMTPDGKRIIFSSNMADSLGRNFDLWMVDTNGTHLEQVTFTPEFDGFPMFSKDGKHIAFCSNRWDAKPHETNVFVADWVP